jgi:integrase
MVGDHKAAQRVASELRARLAQGDLHLAGASPTLEAFATEWLKRYPLLQPVRPGTMDNHRSFVTQHLIPFFGGMPVASITTTTVENFIVSKRQAGGSTRFQGRPLSESSLRTGLASLRLVLQAAVRAGHLRANPLDGLGRIKRNGDENVDPFTGAELRAILGAAQRLRPDFGTMLRLWAQTGVRAGEVCGLGADWGQPRLGSSVPCRSSIPQPREQPSGAQGLLRSRARY